MEIQTLAKGELINLTDNMAALSLNRPAKARNVVMLLQFLAAFSFLWLAALAGTICLSESTAQAQQLSAGDFSINSQKIEKGWWRPESRRAVPHLQIGTVDEIHLSNPELISPRREAANYRRISSDGEPIGIGPSPGLELETQNVSPNSLFRAEQLVPESFFSLLQTRYEAWESRLEDSGPRLNVNGLLVYPLLQVNYASWHLPIGLYIPPLRGTDAIR